MTKEITERKQNIKTPFYKKAIFPWMIILVLATLFGGVVLGWTMKVHADDQAKAEAVNMVSTLSKAGK